MLTDKDLAQMRETANAALPDFAEIQRRTLTPDGYGNATETWEVIPAVPCRITPDKNKKAEVEQAGVVTTIADFLVTLPYETVIRATDRLQINGTQYEVIGENPVTSWLVTKQVKAKVV